MALVPVTAETAPHLGNRTCDDPALSCCEEQEAQEEQVEQEERDNLLWALSILLGPNDIDPETIRVVEEEEAWADRKRFLVIAWRAVRRGQMHPVWAAALPWARGGGGE